jgi:CheY-like chemotaxis protein
LAAGVAHELNNPLSGVVGFSELLLDRPEVHGEAREMVQIVGEEARRAATIVQNLLTFARRREPERREVSVNEVVESALQISDYELKVHNIAIEKDLSSDPVTAPLDRQQILQVFLNLIGNAQQAMHAATGEGTLRISSRADGDNIKVTFRDNGPGISETARSKILEPFFTTKEVGSGTGLGLSIALGIVTQHGGRLYAENGHGEGTGFVVELPGQWPDEMPVPQGTTVTRRERTVKSGNILVVDDERTIRKVLAIALTEDGHQVDTVGDGHAALERLKNQSYDVLFVDLRMPGMDGERLFKVLRQQYPDAARKVVFITGDTTSPDSQEFLEKTGRPFLAKPMTLSEVRGLAQEILEAE